VDDSSIIDLYWNRSETAIQETQQKYGQLCKTIALNILHNNEDSDECVNDTYLAVWSAIPPSHPNHLSSFLGKITRNIALNKYDYYTADKRNSTLTLIFSELEESIPSTYDVHSHYEAGETSRLISEFLRGDSHINRMMFMRRYWFTDSISDIAEQFGMSESKVKSTLFRIRKKLKRYLEKEGVTI
jgi:RNA polymerase sigma factor (sigma-70 family)